MALDRACSGPGVDALAAYVRGELDVFEANRVERHVGECRSCAACLEQEAAFEASLFTLGEIVDAEMHAPLHRRWLARSSEWLRDRLRMPTPPAWGSLALASALAFVVCDRAALVGAGQGMLDEASPTPGAVALRSRDAAPLDQSPPACEEPALMGMASADGPACLEPLAMASFPPEDTDPFGRDAVDAEGVCRPDDGGDLMCADELAAG